MPIRPVVNVRLKNALDIGQIRARCRENDANAEYDRTEDTVGPLTASGIAVTAGNTTKVATWHSFYLERSQGYMSRFWTHASRKAGNGNACLFLATNSRTSAETSTISQMPNSPSIRTNMWREWSAKEQTNSLAAPNTLSLPMIYAGYTALIVGPTQSVYEAPEYRELYEHGKTTDTFTRRMIKATEVPGNFNPSNGHICQALHRRHIRRHHAPLRTHKG
jgi:hypothetical protein